MEHEVICGHNCSALENQTIDDGGVSQVGYVNLVLGQHLMPSPSWVRKLFVAQKMLLLDNAKTLNSMPSYH
jgi:hypothetical protein